MWSVNLRLILYDLGNSSSKFLEWIYLKFCLNINLPNLHLHPDRFPASLASKSKWVGDPDYFTLWYTRCPTEFLHNHVFCYQERAPEASLRQKSPPLAPQLDLTNKTRLPDWAGYWRDHLLLYVYLSDSYRGSDPNYIWPLSSLNIILPIRFAYNLSPYSI